MLKLVRSSFVALALVSLSSSITACGSDDSTGIPDECNPLGGVSCLLPWPSSIYLTPDSSTVTGMHVALPPEAMLVNVDGFQVDPTAWNRFDGFSNVGAILAAFPTGVSPDGLPTHTNLAESQDPDASVVVVNMATGQRILLFAEVEMNTMKDEERTLIIRPMERLQPGTRYAVGIRRSVKAPDGSDLEVPAAFQAILDGKDFNHPLFDQLAAGYDDIFSALAGAGVPRDDLVLAWDFQTASDESLQSDLLTMRDKAMPAMGTNGANLTFSAEEVSGNPTLTYKLYNGTYTSPNFLTDGESDNSIIQRGADDLPELDGMYTANFSAIIPKCVEAAQLPIPVMIFGHGLFGSAEGYLDDNFLQTVANDYCFAVVGGDWIGLTERQITSAAFASNDLNRSHALSEKLGQAVINFIALEQAVQGPMLTAPEFQYNSQQILDTTQIFYLGASLGGIMGGTFMSYDPVITRGALGVPGADWSLLYERSTAWQPLQIAAIAAYEDMTYYQLLQSFLAWSMERWDPITTARNVLSDPLPNTPAKQLLLYEAVNDALVANMSTELFARTLDIPVCGPSIRTPYSMVEHTTPAPSALTIYDEKVEPTPSTNIPPRDDNGTHADINEYPAVLRQVEHFFFNGEVINECFDGETPVPCDCTTGACD